MEKNDKKEIKQYEENLIKNGFTKEQVGSTTIYSRPAIKVNVSKECKKAEKE